MRAFVSSAISTPFLNTSSVFAPFSLRKAREKLTSGLLCKRVPSQRLPVHCPLVLLPALAAINHRFLYLGAPQTTFAPLATAPRIP